MEAIAASLAQIVADFRNDDGIRIDADHVLRWAYQFDEQIRLRLVDTMRNFLQAHYLSKERVDAYLLGMLRSPNLCAGDPLTYWSSTRILSDQERGRSQVALVQTMLRLASREFGPDFRFGHALSSRAFYVDDCVFTAGRVKEDADRWINSVRQHEGRFHLDLGLLGVHALGEYFFDLHFNRSTAPFGARFSRRMLRFKNFENRKARRSSSQVLWPSITSTSIGFPEFHSDSVILRVPPGGVAQFWTEGDRAFLEKVLLDAGCRICGSCDARSPMMRPLGYGAFGYGFGSMFFSYLNCPNNAPLAIWWTARTARMPGGWNALLPRRVNE